MSKVDWSLAPDWCKGFGLIGVGNFEVWFDDHYYQYLRDGKKHAFAHGCTFNFRQLSSIEMRQSKSSWSGPEDGLPPVGMEVIVHECTHDYTKQFNGQLVRIIAHDDKCAVFAADNFEYHALIADKFKLPPTAEQIAQEARDKAIREMIEVCKETAQSGDFRLTTETVAAFTVRNFGRLVDAGFKR